MPDSQIQNTRYKRRTPAGLPRHTSGSPETGEDALISDKACAFQRRVEVADRELHERRRVLASRLRGFGDIVAIDLTVNACACHLGCRASASHARVGVPAPLGVVPCDGWAKGVPRVRGGCSGGVPGLQHLL